MRQLDNTAVYGRAVNCGYVHPGATQLVLSHTTFHGNSATFGPELPR